MREFPAFQEVYDKHAGAFELISIAVNDSGNPRQIVQENGYSWKFGVSDTATMAYKFNAIPTTVFIDADGNVVEQHTGGMDAEDFENRLTRIL